MSKKVQRQYSAELKASAVKMVIEELKTLSQVSQDLHIPLQTLHSLQINVDFKCGTYLTERKVIKLGQLG